MSVEEIIEDKKFKVDWLVTYYDEVTDEEKVSKVTETLEYETLEELYDDLDGGSENFNPERLIVPPITDEESRYCLIEVDSITDEDGVIH